MRIIYEQPDNTVAVIVPALGYTVDDCIKDIPEDALRYKAVKKEDIESDRVFRNAWMWDDKEAHSTDINKAKDIAHNHRRNKREEELSPYDEVIMKQIPGTDSTEAEIERAAIRSKYDKIQVDIDSCSTVDELKTVVAAEELTYHG